MIINDIFQVASILTPVPKPMPKITPQPTFQMEMDFNKGNEYVLTEPSVGIITFNGTAVKEYTIDEGRS